MRLPDLPREGDGIAGIIRYLQTMEKDFISFVPSLVSGTIGMIGVRGFSSTGVSSQNFVQRVSLSNVTTGMWTFTNPESDVSYMLWIQGVYPASSIITRMDKTTTSLLLTCVTGLSGMACDVLLLR